MWYVRRTVEKLVNAMATISLDHAAVLSLRMLLDDIAWVSEEHARFNKLNRLVEALSRGFDDAHTVGVGQRFLANVICLIQIAVEAAVVKSNVDIENVTILEYSLIWNAVTNDLIW